ncbi:MULTISPECIES: tyrosine-type recombinase/integrase [Actinosynnema]|uniref:tyrosine-type recombinase/integrase n=1 Tax=Actinosynnema TaxID=40566 RepID=UPI0020A2A2EC|nr:tyrosine-type recombinase/integrase [Actinosynnema pretiosum]
MEVISTGAAFTRWCAYGTDVATPGAVSPDTPVSGETGVSGPVGAGVGEDVPAAVGAGAPWAVGAPPQPTGVYLPPGGHSLAKLVVAFLARPDLSANTAAAYRTDLRLFLGWCREHALDPFALGLPESQVFGHHLRTTPSARIGQLRSGRSVARALNAVSSFYTYLVRAGPPTTHHPAAQAARPKYDRRHSTTRSLSEAQARAVCAATTTAAPCTWPSGSAPLAVHLMIDLGARVSEVCGANLTDLGHRADPGGALFRTITLRMKGEKVRVRPLPVQLVPLLERWLAHRIADPGEPALLVDRDGARITRHQVAHLITTLATAAGIPEPHRVTPHSTRHAFNTIAKARGTTLEQRQHTLAHASPDTTALYDHTDDLLAADPAHLVATATTLPIDGK